MGYLVKHRNLEDGTRIFGRLLPLAQNKGITISCRITCPMKRCAYFFCISHIIKPRSSEINLKSSIVVDYIHNLTLIKYLQKLVTYFGNQIYKKIAALFC